MTRFFGRKNLLLNGYHLFSSVQLLSRVWLFATPWIAACQASLSITNSQSSLRLTSVESMMPSSHLILCRPLLLLCSIPPSIRVFSYELTLSIAATHIVFAVTEWNEIKSANHRSGKNRDCSTETVGKNLTAHSVAIHITFFSPKKQALSLICYLVSSLLWSIIHFEIQSLFRHSF